MRTSVIPGRGPRGRFRLLALVTSITLPLEAVGITTEVLTANADVHVSEDSPDENRSGFSLLQAGIGRGRKVGEMRAYVRFPLGSIPGSTLLKTTRVEKAAFGLLAQSLGLASAEDRFFVSVANCPNNGWAEEKMTWQDRVCPQLAQAEDVIAVDSADLPQLYRWDVRRGVAEAMDRRASQLTLVISAFKLPRLRGGEREVVPGQPFGPSESPGFVRFWSRERAALGGTPTLTVTFDRRDTDLLRFGKTALAFLSAVSLLLGLWQGTRKALGARTDRA